MASRPQAQIVVSIAAQNQYSAALSRFRSELQAIQAPLAKIQQQQNALAGNTTTRSPFGFDVPGIAEARRHVVGLRTAVSGLFPHIGGLGALGTAAGIGVATQQFADMGVSLENTARMAGMTAAGLNSMRGAATLAGVATSSVDSSMVGLRNTLNAAAFGRPEGNQAARLMQQWGIAFGNAREGARPLEEVLRKLVPILQQLYRVNPQAAASVAASFGISADALPLLAQGNDELDRRRRIANELNGMTPEMIASSQRYTESLGRMTLASQGLRNSLVVELEPALTGIMTEIQTRLPGAGRRMHEFGDEVRWVLDRIRELGHEAGADRVPGFISGIMSWFGQRQAATMSQMVPGSQAPAGASEFNQDVFNMIPDAPRRTLYQTNSDARTRFNQQFMPQRYGAPGGNSVPPQLGGPWNPNNTGGASFPPGRQSADTTLPPEARALLDTIAGPESGGRYDVRWGSRTPITDFSHHPNILEPTGRTRPDGSPEMSGAAGRYQFVQGTWNQADRLAGGNGNFSPAAQDRAAWALAQSEYRRQTGRDLLTDLRDPSRRGAIAQVMSGSNLWTSFNAGRLQQNLDRYRAQASAAGPPAAPAAVSTQAPAAPGGTTSNNGTNTVRVEIEHKNVPEGVSMRASTQGDTVELSRIRIAKAMPETRVQ